MGMDPSFRNWGFAAGLYHLESRKLQMLRVLITQTAKTKVKNSRVSTDDLSRARLLADDAFQIAKEAQVVFVEVPTGSQSARAMCSYGVCVGILASLRSQGIPFIEVAPLDIKLATVGDKTATKEAIIARAVKKYPKLDWPSKTRNGQISLTSGKCEHVADAIGAIEAGVRSEAFDQLMALKS